MRPITIEKREMIIAAKKRGESPEAIALWVDVSISSVYNICRLYNKSNSIEPKPFPGRQSRLTSEQIEEIKKTVEAQGDITLEELIEKLNLPIKKSRLSLILIRMGFSFKKDSSSQCATPGRRQTETQKLEGTTKGIRSKKAHFSR